MATTDTDITTPEPAAAEPSIRDALDAAFAKPASDEVDAPEPEPAAPKTTAAPAEANAPAEGRVRDEHGRFAPKTADAPAAVAAPAGPNAPMTTAPQPLEMKAPASWKPEAREKWNQLDPLVRHEVSRREYEAQHVIQDAAQQRNFMREFQRVVGPYEVFIRQEGGNPLAAVQNLMQTAADLRVGTPQHKVGLVADIITRYGIDLKQLDDVLSAKLKGQPPTQQVNAPQQYRDPRLDQLLAENQRYMQEQQQAQENQWRGELQAFGGTHEFYFDVADIMADLVESKARRQQPVDIEALYKQACQMHDGVSTILSQRAASAKSTGNAQAVLRARRAAVSVKGDSTPQGATVPKDDSIRAALEAAFESAGNRV